MAATAFYPNVYVIQSYSFAICQNLQTNFKKLKNIEKKREKKKRNLFKTTRKISN
jgi:hypothetical protein